MKVTLNFDTTQNLKSYFKIEPVCECESLQRCFIDDFQLTFLETILNTAVLLTISFSVLTPFS